MISLKNLQNLGLLGVMAFSLTATADELTDKAVELRTQNLETHQDNKALNIVAAGAIAETHVKQERKNQHDELITQEQINTNRIKLAPELERLKKTPAKFAKVIDGMPPQQREQLLKNNSEVSKIYLRGKGIDSSKMTKEEIAEAITKQSKELNRKIKEVKEISGEVAETSKISADTSKNMQKMGKTINESVSGLSKVLKNINSMTKDLNAFNEGQDQERAAQGSPDVAKASEKPAIIDHNRGYTSEKTGSFTGSSTESATGSSTGSSNKKASASGLSK
jgi:ABC-type transporter Mla subunit MlaD